MATCGKCHQQNVDVDHVRACYAAVLVGVGAQRAGGNGNQWRLDSTGNLRPIRDAAAGTTAEDQWRTGNQAGRRPVEGNHDASGANLRDHEQTRRSMTPGCTGSPDWQVVNGLRAQIKEHLFERNGHAEGSFAIKDAQGVVKFYEINTGKARGRWAGKVFVNACASDDRHPVRSAQTLAWVLQEILSDVQAARQLYASELGHCYVCHKELTDEESRARGIGPVCAGKYL